LNFYALAPKFVCLDLIIISWFWKDVTVSKVMDYVEAFKQKFSFNSNRALFLFIFDFM